MNNIYFDLQINASAAAIFRAVSDPAELIKWWPLKCTGDAQLGGEYNYFFGEKYDWYAKVMQFVPNQSIHFKMTKADDDWNPTTFGYDLKEVEGGTLLQFVHKDWPYLNHHYRHSGYCWAHLLKGLKDLVEQGQETPFLERS